MWWLAATNGVVGINSRESLGESHGLVKTALPAASYA